METKPTTISKVIAFELGLLIAVLTWIAFAGIPGMKHRPVAESEDRNRPTRRLPTCRRSIRRHSLSDARRSITRQTMSKWRKLPRSSIPLPLCRPMIPD